jgi:hypothetical protein
VTRASLGSLASRGSPASLGSLGSLGSLALGAAIIALGALATGCLPTLAAESAAPPGRAARLDEDVTFWGTKHYRVELSQGVALAISCRDGGPCEKLVATSDNPAIAEVRTASLAALRPAGYSGNQQSAAAVIVVGKAPGITTIRVRSKTGGRDVPISVIAPPLHSPPAAAAR